MLSHVKWGCVAVFATSVTAHAADIAPTPVYKAPVTVSDIVNWTGFYVGGNAGGTWADFSSRFDIAASRATAASTLPFNGDANTFIGGAQAGYNWQLGQWVIGVEGDADARSLRRRVTLGTGTLPAIFVPGDSFQDKAGWQASARLRVGYAWDRWLVYVTGGAAFTELKVSTDFIASGLFPASVVSRSRTLTGATVGGGVEYAISRNLSFGVEGRYTDYGGSNAALGTIGVFNTDPVGFNPVFAPVTSRVEMNAWEVTGRLNWRFDWGAPIIAKD